MNGLGEWDVNMFESYLLRDVFTEVLKIHLPQFVTFPDTPFWKGSPSGYFSVATAYQLASLPVENPMFLDWVWKLKIPQNLKGFLWLIFHDKLLTNALRMLRGLSKDASCPRCHHHLEDVEHLVRSCMHSKHVWDNLVDRHGCVLNRQGSFLDWFKRNLHPQTDVVSNWSLVFAVAIWQIWKDRNRIIFDNIDPSWQKIVYLIYNFVYEIQQAFDLNLHSNRPRHDPLPVPKS